MDNKEKIYDEKISPLMTEIIKICKEEEIPMFAEFQYGDGEFCKTLVAKEGHMIFEMLEAMSQCIEDNGVNIDKFYLWCNKRYPNQSSVVLTILSNLRQL